MRVARYIQPMVVHHVISRFVDRAWAFRDDTEREMYLRRLAHAVSASDWRCLAFALMSNHVHLAMVAGTTELGSWLKRTHSPFANWLNKRHDRLGPVFAERPAVWAVRPASEARLIAYIHTNPVRAGVAARASDSTWTSHRAYLAGVPAPPWLDTDEGLRRCGVPRSAFDAWVHTASSALDYPQLDGLRRAVHRFGAIELATSTSPPTTTPLVARPFGRVRPPAAEIVTAVAAVLRLAPDQFCSRARRPELIRARRITVHVARSVGVTVADASAALGITRQSGSRLAGESVDDRTAAAIMVIADQLGTRQR